MFHHRFFLLWKEGEEEESSANYFRGDTHINFERNQIIRTCFSSYNIHYCILSIFKGVNIAFYCGTRCCLHIYDDRETFLLKCKQTNNWIKLSDKKYLWPLSKSQNPAQILSPCFLLLILNGKSLLRIFQPRYVSTTTRISGFYRTTSLRPARQESSHPRLKCFPKSWFLPLYDAKYTFLFHNTAQYRTEYHLFNSCSEHAYCITLCIRHWSEFML